MSIPFTLSYFSAPILQAHFSSTPGCPPASSPCSRPPLDPAALQTCDYGFKRLVPFLESPPVGAGILAFTIFFFIVFLSDIILRTITSLTLGIVVTISTFGILALIIALLFLL